MAFHRRRTFRRRRARRPIFGKRAAKAIMAISQKPVETKCFTRSLNYSTYLNTNGYVAPADSFAIRSNIFSGIPRADSVSVKTENEVIGNELMARGFWIRVNLNAAVSPTAGHYGTQFRLTVYSIADQRLTAPYNEVVSASDSVFDSDFVQAALTQKPFNMQYVNVLKSHRWEARFDGNEDNFQSEHRMWVPIRGKKISTLEEGILASSVFGDLKGRNYYWMLEIYTPGASNLTTGVAGSIDSKVYFKDA